jgi:hypothetical protein
MNGRGLVLRAAREAAEYGGLAEGVTIRDPGTVDWIADGIEGGQLKQHPTRDVAAQAPYRTVTGHPFVEGLDGPTVVIDVAIWELEG